MKRVLIPVDGTKGTRDIFTAFSRLVRPAEEVILLRVEQLAGRSMMIDMLGEAELETLKESVQDTPFKERLDEQANRILEHYRQKLAGNDSQKVRTLIRVGIPAVEILKVAEEEKADLIIMGSNGNKGLQRLVSGSVTKDVERGARVPVLVAKNGGEDMVHGWREAYAAQ